MPDFVHTHISDIYWAIFCVLVAISVHFLPIIKAWLTAKQAAAETEAKRLKAFIELMGGDVEAFALRIRADSQAEITALEARVQTLEKQVDDKVRADAASVEEAVTAEAAKV